MTKRKELVDPKISITLLIYAEIIPEIITSGEENTETIGISETSTPKAVKIKATSTAAEISIVTIGDIKEV